MEALILFGALALIAWSLVLATYFSKKQKGQHSQH